MTLFFDGPETRPAQPEFRITAGTITAVSVALIRAVAAGLVAPRQRQVRGVLRQESLALQFASSST